MTRMHIMCARHAASVLWGQASLRSLGYPYALESIILRTRASDAGQSAELLSTATEPGTDMLEVRIKDVTYRRVYRYSFPVTVVE